jgi:putative toxin-antitoxin system antitoxin component (TIGR02293 family)
MISACCQTANGERGHEGPKEPAMGKAAERDPRAILIREIESSGVSEGSKSFFGILLSRTPRTHLDAQMPVFEEAVAKPGSAQTIFSGRLADECFAETVRRGVPVQAIDALVDHEVLSLSEIVTHVLPRRTLDHRKRKKERLNESESERALRIARIVAIAEDTFANIEKAATWLRRPNRLLGGRAPLDMTDTEPGGRIVEGILQRIAHGIAA